MPIAGSRRTSGADLEVEREDRAMALKNAEPQEVPTVDVSGKGKLQSRAASTNEPLSKEKQDKLLKRKEQHEPRGNAEGKSSKKSKSNVGDEREVLDLDVGDTRASQVGYRQLTLGANPPPRPLASPSLLYNKEFMDNWDAPGWGKWMREVMEAPPLPVLTRNWDTPQRKIVGDCLAKRVAANIKSPPRLDVKTIASSALTEFGLSIHAVSTCLHSVIMGAQQAADRESKLMSEDETLKKTLADNERILQETTEKMAEEVRKAKELYVAQKSEMQKLREEITVKSEASEKAEKTAEENLAAVRIDFENSLKSAEERTRVAEERAARAGGRIAGALKEYKDNDEFWDFLTESYDHGIFHMARCFRRAADQGVTPTLEDLVAYVLEDPFSTELVAYHSTYPFKSSEID